MDFKKLFLRVDDRFIVFEKIIDGIDGKMFFLIRADDTKSMLLRRMFLFDSIRLNI